MLSNIQEIQNGYANVSVEIGKLFIGLFCEKEQHMLAHAITNFINPIAIQRMERAIQGFIMFGAE